MSLSPPGSEASASAGPAGGPPRRIVIVEDYADAREALKIWLELQGHQVEAVPDGARGLEVILARPPDVALIDIELPDLGGHEVARRLRATPQAQRVFLVALTGHGQPYDRDRALAAGFDAHLVKPVDEQVLGRLLSGMDGPAAPPRS